MPYGLSEAGRKNGCGHSTAHAWHALNACGLALMVPAALLILRLPAWAKSRQPLSAKAEAS